MVGLAAAQSDELLRMMSHLTVNSKAALQAQP